MSQPARVAPIPTTLRCHRQSVGASDGSIIATVIAIHIPRNDASAAAHVWPGMRVHIIDMVQPPGIGISFIEAHAFSYAS